jgi:hypothetical protein
MDNENNKDNKDKLLHLGQQRVFLAVQYEKEGV